MTYNETTLRKKIIYNEEDAEEFIEVAENNVEVLIRSTIITSGFPVNGNWEESYHGIKEDLMKEGYEEI